MNSEQTLQKSDLEIKLEKENEQQKTIIKKLEDEKQLLEEEKLELIEKVHKATKDSKKVKSFLEGIEYDY